MTWNDLWVAIQPILITALSAILPLLVAALTAWIVQELRLIQQRIKSYNPTQYEQLYNLAIDGVKLAEQLKISSIINANERKAIAVAYVQKWADEHKLKVSISDIENAIEIAVFNELKKEGIVPSNVEQG